MRQQMRQCDGQHRILRQTADHVVMCNHGLQPNAKGLVLGADLFEESSCGYEVALSV